MSYEEIFKITEMRSCINMYKRIYRFNTKLKEPFFCHLSMYGKLSFIDFGQQHEGGGKCFFIKNGHGLTLSGVTESTILRLTMMKKQTILLNEIDFNIQLFFNQ